MDATIFESALSQARRSDASKKETKIACPLLDVFACGQISSPRLYRLKLTFPGTCSWSWTSCMALAFLTNVIFLEKTLGANFAIIPYKTASTILANDIIVRCNQTRIWLTITNFWAISAGFGRYFFKLVRKAGTVETVWSYSTVVTRFAT